MVELAERVAELSGIPDAHVFFTTSGTEANDAALLLATAYRRSNQILALRNSYHGRSFSTIAITGNRSWSPTSLSGLSVNYVHGGYRLRVAVPGLDDAAYTAACVQDLRDVLTMCTSGDVAAMIAEPIQGVGGFAVPPDGFFGAMHEVLAESGILFISDEVQTGWGRTGEHFWGIRPTAPCPTSSPSPRASATVSPSAASWRTPRSWTACRPRRSPRSAATRWRRPAPCATLNYLHRPRSAGQRAQARLGVPRAAAARSPSVIRSSPRSAARGLMVALELCQPGRHRAVAARRGRADGGVQAPGPADRQGRPVRQRAAHRPADEPQRDRGPRRPGHPGSGHRGDRPVKTLITNGTVVGHHRRHRRRRAGRRRDDRRAVRAGRPPRGPADRTIDATGKYVIPGGIDVHTHMELPFGGTVAADTFDTGTRAAAFGGTTTIIDFAVQRTGEVRARRRWPPGTPRPTATAPSTTASTMILGGVDDDALKAMDQLVANEGITSFKLFMAYPGRLLLRRRPDPAGHAEGADNGAMIMMHAENGPAIDVLVKQALDAGETDPIYHGITRPQELEGEATSRAILLAGVAGNCPLYIVHLSASKALEAVAAARDIGRNVFAETCPQYLYLTPRGPARRAPASRAPSGSARRRCAPSTTITSRPVAGPAHATTWRWSPPTTARSA